MRAGPRKRIDAVFECSERLDRERSQLASKRDTIKSGLNSTEPLIEASVHLGNSQWPLTEIEFQSTIISVINHVTLTSVTELFNIQILAKDLREGCLTENLEGGEWVVGCHHSSFN